MAYYDEPDADGGDDDDTLVVSGILVKRRKKTYKTPGNMTSESLIFFSTETWSCLMRIAGIVNIITSQARETPELTE